MSDEYDPNYKPPDPATMTDQEKIRVAYDWKQAGMPVVEIADYFKVCQKTVYNWINKYRDEFLNELEATRSLDIVVKQLHDITDLSDLCLRIAHQIGQEKAIDPRTGKIIQKKGSLRDQAEMLRLVRDFKRMEIELQMSTGIIPKEPERIYGALQERHAVAEEIDDDEITSRPDLERKALERLKKQNWLS